MLKRWMALPRDIRWTIGGIAVVLLVLVMAWALFVPIADWLAHHDVGSVKGSLHETALDNVRDRLLTLGAGLFAAGALAFTARNFSLSREGQVTDRYTKAIEQLGSDKLDVRIGGVYALERVARDSARDHPTVMEVLVAFIREHSHEKWSLPEPIQIHGLDWMPDLIRPDVQAALTVVGRRVVERDIRRIVLVYADLRGADLTGADLSCADLRFAQLTEMNLDCANLGGADLRNADLNDARLTGADLRGVNLDHVRLSCADLRKADLRGADLTGARLAAAHLTGADLTGARLANAELVCANLVSADLTGADLTGALLTCADLTGADLRNAHLTGADLGGAKLRGARWPEGTPVPEGWKRGGDGGLGTADSDSSPTGAS